MKQSEYSSSKRSTPSIALAVALLIALAGCKKKDAYLPPEPVNPHFVTLTWNAGKSTVRGYNIYRLTPSGEPQKLNIGFLLVPEYVDHTAQGGQTYTYFVTSLNFWNVESNPSARVTVGVPATVPAPPQAPGTPAASGAPPPKP